jgi:hypothetical protein
MKAESLVIANQNVAVNTFPGLVHTARHTTKAGNTQSRWANPALNLGKQIRLIRVDFYSRKLAERIRPASLS